MTTEISFADWVDWLAIELTFVELYRSAPPSLQREIPSLQREMMATVRRLAEGIDKAEFNAFVSQVPHFERALESFSPEEQRRFVPQLSNAVTTLAEYVAGLYRTPRLKLPLHSPLTVPDRRRGFG